MHRSPAATVQTGVVDEIGNDTRQAAAVTAQCGGCAAWINVDWRAGECARAHSLFDKLSDTQLVAHNSHGASVVAGDLQKIFNETAEPSHIGNQQVEGGLSALGQFVAPRHHHLY